MKFAFLLEQGSPEEAFGVEFVGLPGCFSAGDTREEALNNAKDALKFHLEGLQEMGEDIPEQKSFFYYQQQHADRLADGCTLHEIECAV